MVLKFTDIVVYRETQSFQKPIPSASGQFNFEKKCSNMNFSRAFFKNKFEITHVYGPTTMSGALTIVLYGC